MLSWLFFCYGMIFIMWRLLVVVEMKKLELFNRALSLIEEETEVSRDLILSANKKEEVVDARSLLVYTLYEQGIYPQKIAELSGICPRCIQPFILKFRDRMESRRILGINYENVRRRLRETDENTPS